MNKPKLTITSALAFGLFLALSLYNCGESVLLWIGSRTTNNLLHCMGWLLLAAVTVSFFRFERPKVHSLIDMLKPLLLMALCMWLCYFPRLDSLVVAAALGLSYLLSNLRQQKRQAHL